MLPLCLTITGGIGGLFAGAASVPDGSGLAGPATVVWAGGLGGALGFAAGLVALSWLPPSGARTATLASTVLALVAVAAVAVAFTMERRRAETEAAAAAARDAAVFHVEVTRPRPGDGSTFTRIAVDGARAAFDMARRGAPDSDRCAGPVTEADRLRVLDALRRLDSLVARVPDACTAGDTLMIVRWSLPDARAGTRTINVTPACERSHGEFTALYVPLEGIAFSAASAPACGAADGAAAP